MAALVRIEEPRLRPAPVKAAWDAFVSMAFRPFYLLAAMQGVVAILAWGLGYGGTRALPSFLWHGHEMIWGHAGAVIVGFGSETLGVRVPASRARRPSDPLPWTREARLNP